MTEAKTVLVVDDDTPIRELEAAVLQNNGYRVREAGGGVPAIEYLKGERPDLVLLDLRMPDVDGWGVLDFISQLPDPPRVVVVSGYNEVVPPGHLAHCVGGYVHKPFDVRQLVRTCEAVLALELVVPASGSRREARRTFIVEATLLSEEGIPLLTGQVQNISPRGMQVEVMMRFREGDNVRIAIQLPGSDKPVVVPARVAWRKDDAVGVELHDVDPADEQLLRTLLG